MRQPAKIATGSLRAPHVLTVLLASTALFASMLPGHAQDSTWSTAPGSDDFNTPGNWSNGVPAGTAFFGASSIVNLNISDGTPLNEWTFLSGAPNYQITNTSLLSFLGDGITVNGGGVSVVNNFHGTIFFNINSSAGSASFLNQGVIVFLVGSTAGSAIILNSNLLQFTSSSTAADATITTQNGATTSFYTNASGGNARFILEAGGLLDISDIAGTSITAGSIEGTGSTPPGAGNIYLGNKELVVGGNNRSTVFSGVIDDGGFGGKLTKVGSGTLTLTGTSTYTGDTTIDGGTLLVNGSTASSLLTFVRSGATLGGTGTVGATFLDNGATLAPGTPTTIGTLTINDHVTFCVCSTFAVKVSSTGSDSVNVVAGLGTGDAFLAGAVKASLLDGSYRFGTPYTILTTAGGINGTKFDSLILPTGLTGALGYTANDVTLTLNSVLSQTPGLSGNQQRIANVIDAGLHAGNPIGAFSGVFDGDINGKLAQLAGQPANGTQQAGMQMTGSFLTTVMHPTGTAPGGGSGSVGATGYAAEQEPSSEAAAAYAAVMPKDRRAAPVLAEPRWGVWGQVYGGLRKTDGDAATGAPDATARTYGVATGFDYRVSPDTMIGLALAGGSTHANLADALGSSKSEVFQMGLYGTQKLGAAYVSAVLSYAWHDASTDRTVTVSGIDRLVADFSAHSFGGRLEAGYRVDAPIVSVTPYAAVQVQSFHTPSYTETALLGSNTFALTYDAKTTTATRTELGAWFDKTVILDGGSAVTWRARAAWAHDFTNDQSISAAFQTLPGASFTVDGARTAPNAALLSAGAELRLINNWSVAAKFDSEFASGARTYAGTGTLRYVW